MKTSVAIIVPIYRLPLTADEEVSMAKLRLHLGRYRRIIIAPFGLSLADFPDFEIKRFSNRFFRNVLSYNRLLLSRKFYRSFTAAEWILIYQLDSLVLRDELEKWLHDDFDFIGAPVFSHEGDFVGVNGGFSLRRVQTFMEALEGIRTGGISSAMADMPFMGRNLVTRLIKLILLLLHKAGIANALPWLVLKSGYHEDIFWSEYAHMFALHFRLAPFDLARQFAFEDKPRRLFQLNGDKLPFGCHAWRKWDSEFWKKFLTI